jgi:hypothetical protein
MDLMLKNIKIQVAGHQSPVNSQDKIQAASQKPEPKTI